MRVLALALLCVACSTAPVVTQPTPTPTREPNTFAVSVLLDLSGPRAPNGTPQRNAMQLWLDQQQPVAGVRLRAKFVDVASSDARVLLELRRAIVDDHADAVVIGVPVVVDDVFGQAIEVAAVPVLLTLPASEPAATVGGRWTFVLAPTPAALARAAVNDISARSALAPVLVASDQSAPAMTERAALVAELARQNLQPPSPVNVIRPEGVARMRAEVSGARSVVLTGPAASYTAFIRGMPATATSPLLYLSYLTETADLANVRDQSAIVTWPGSRGLATLSSAPLPGARAAFVQSYTERSGAPSTLAGTAYDALGVLQFAGALAPSALDPARLRLRLETLTFGGVVTMYRFTFTRHAGFSEDDLAYLRWNPQRNAPFVAPAPKE